MPRLSAAVILSATIALLPSSSPADVVYATSGPFGGPFGVIGFDVFAQQSVGVRFVPSQTVRLDRIKVWLMDNSGGGHPLVTLELRPDQTSGGVSTPSPIVRESWTFPIAAVGWVPQQEIVQSSSRPILEAGVRAWVVARSSSSAGMNPVWNWASQGSGFVATTNGSPEAWQPGGFGAVVSIVVEGTPWSPPSPDLNDDGVVDGTDLTMLLAAWGACPPKGDCIADLDENGQVDGADLVALLAAWS